MGAIDEHWCSDCKKTLDKQKDEYLDMENIRLKEFPGKKGIICKECLKKPKYRGLRKLLGAGNPNFLPFLECGLHAVCRTFKPVKARAVRCAHLAVIGDTIYCKRKHPGSLKLPVERAERIRMEQQVILKVTRRAFRQLPPEVAENAIAAFTQGTKNIWVPPSAVIAEEPSKIEEVLGSS